MDSRRPTVEIAKALLVSATSRSFSDFAERLADAYVIMVKGAVGRRDARP